MSFAKESSMSGENSTRLVKTLVSFSAKLILGLALVIASTASAQWQEEPVKKVDIYISNYGGPGNASKFRMVVAVNGLTKGNFLVSPGLADPRAGYMNTPSGVFHPTQLKEIHYSSQSNTSWFYDGDPMPFTIFFKGGFAIHGSYGLINGKKASHGCVRLNIEQAQRLYGWVQESIKNSGRQSVTIYIEDTDLK